MQIHEEHIAMTAVECVEVITVAARYEWLKRQSSGTRYALVMIPPEQWDETIDLAMQNMRAHSVPTMGDEAESALSQYRCQCGNPMLPGWMHSTTVACYKVGDASGS